MANAGCINAYDCNGCLIQTLQNLDSACIGVGVQYTAPNPLDDKRLDYIKYTDKCGCVQCLSGENEILIYATDGVIKDLTLTNDDVNEAIKIKWNDIFGSNRVKTIVRYKTGSYPVSITDGTLAVEETTKNQYSSTPFSLSGVLDETTYYISAFAVDSDDTIINVQGMSITTSFFLSKYQAVEYIGRNGNNYIDTGWIPKQTVPFEVQIGYKISTSGVRYGVLSNYSSNASNGELSFEINSGSNTSNKPRYYLQHSQGSIDGFSSNTMISNSFNDIKFINNASSGQQINLNGTLTNVSGTYYGISQNYSAYLFIDRQLRRGTFSYNSFVSYLKIYEQGTLIHDFVPCYRKSDNVIGLIDKVTKSFLTNKGSGTFSKGSNIPR